MFIPLLIGEGILLAEETGMIAEVANAVYRAAQTVNAALNLNNFLNNLNNKLSDEERSQAEDAIENATVEVQDRPCGKKSIRVYAKGVGQIKGHQPLRIVTGKQIGRAHV